MIDQLYACEQVETLHSHHDRIRVCTHKSMQFEDITERIDSIVRRARIAMGFVNIQSLHTTAAILVNEHEPLLLSDMEGAMERIFPRGEEYRHDDMRVRTVNLTPDEKENGHSHCKAMFLRSGQVLNVVDGRLQLGRWQRVFFIELDCPRERNVSVMVIGIGTRSATRRLDR